MEYEIEDGEEFLFDKSTNPSLLHHKHPAVSSPRPHWAYPRDARSRRRAVPIPEEETQPS